MMLEAAKNALALSKYGINPHIYAAPYMTKTAYNGSKGSSEARGNFDPNGKIQTNFALLPWDGKNLASNPCIRLDMSGLTAYDIDKGLEGLSDEEILEKVDRLGLPRTYMTRTGRPTGGATLFYRGVRTHPDVQGFKVGSLTGDLKCHGHCATVGSLYRFKDERGKPTDQFTFYRCIRDVTFAPLPFWLRDYKFKTKTVAPTEVSSFDADWLKRTEGEDVLAKMLKKAHDYKEQNHAALASGKFVTIKSGELIPVGGRKLYLRRQAGIMRKQSLPPEIVRIALDICAVRRCVDGRKFIITHKNDLDIIAGWSETQWTEGEYMMKASGVIIDGVMSETRKPLIRHDYLVRALREYPHQKLTSAEMFAVLKASLSRTKFKLKKKSSRSEEVIRRAREATGFTVLDRTGGIVTWERSPL
jgi:Bifunctional DNA primase/polymerase, N-terminal